MMNKKTKIMFVCMMLSVVVVVGIMIYLAYDITTNFNKEETTEKTTETSTDTQNVQTSDFTEDAGHDINYIPPSTEYIEDDHNYVFVGDSRYVAMQALKGENDTFICDNGVGRFFLLENSDKIISAASAPNSRIVIGLGVNDIINADEYLVMLKDFRTKTDAEMFYVLVNPVDESLCRANGYSITNSAINSFNDKMIDGLADVDINIIDVNSFLKSTGYSCSDGLHYTNETYGTIFHYLKTTLSHY